MHVNGVSLLEVYFSQSENAIPYDRVVWTCPALIGWYINIVFNDYEIIIVFE